MNEDEKITQWFINNIKGTPNEEQLALKKVYEQNEEIEKLKAINDELAKELHEARHTKYERYVVPEIENKNQEIERLRNIIKEVREYIEENQEEHKYTDRGGFTYTEGHFLRDSDTLLEILGRENNDK